jgi:hypothetical protein
VFVKWIVCIEILLQMSLGDLLVQDVGEILVRLRTVELGAHVNDGEESNRFFLRPAFRGCVKYSMLCLQKMSKYLDQNIVNGNRKNRPVTLHTKFIPLPSHSPLALSQ